MKTKQQIEQEIQNLRAILDKVITETASGDSNTEAVEAQIMVLDERYNEDEAETLTEDQGEHVINAAREAAMWLAGESEKEKESLAADWPLKK